MFFPIMFLIVCGVVVGAAIGLATLVGREPESSGVDVERKLP